MISFVLISAFEYLAYSYRGLMIDTARHFLPVSTIIQHLELMSLNKLNTLHIHIVDGIV